MKKNLLVLALASSLILTGCGPKSASSTSASESAGDVSSSEQTSDSGSSSDNSTPVVPVDPEADYKVSKDEFVDIFLNSLSNVTVKEGFSGGFANVKYYNGRYCLDVSGDGSGDYFDYRRVDEKGVITGFDVRSDGSLGNVSNPEKIGDVSPASYFDALRASVFYNDFKFLSLSVLFPGVFDAYCGTPYLSAAQLKQYLETVYDLISYNSETHSYSMLPGVEENKTFTPIIYFSSKSLTKIVVEAVDSASKKTTTEFSFSDYGTTDFAIPTEYGNYLDYHTIRFYQSDAKTLLYTQYVAYGQAVGYQGSFRYEPDDDTGAYQLEGWTLMGDSALLSDAYLNEIYGNHDLVAKWKQIDNADLYTFDSSTNTLTYGGKGKIGIISVPSVFETGGVQYPVSFLNLDNLTSTLTKVEIPASVSSIERASEETPYLSAVEFAVSTDSQYFAVTNGALTKKDGSIIYSYYQGTQADKYTVADNVKYIADRAFAGSNLKEIDLSATHLGILGKACFENSASLTTIDFPSAITALGASCFAKCFSLERLDMSSLTSLTSIGDSCFEEDNLLHTVKLPSSLKTIGARAFYGIDVYSLALPKSLETIGEGAFYNCKTLSKVTVSSENTSADLLKSDEIFYGCGSLKTFVIPDIITSIGVSCFRDCAQYVFNLPSALTTIGSNAFDGALGPSELSLPKGVTDAGLGGSVFSYVKGLTSVSLSDTSLTELPTNLFSGCSNLVSVTLPSTVTKIDDGCFADTGLTSFTIAANMKISVGAFDGCTKLSLVNLNTTDYYLDETGHFLFTADKTSLIDYVGLPVSFLAPSALTGIDGGFFYNLTSLTTVDLSAVTSASFSIGLNAFSGCSNLNSFTWPTSSSVQISLNDNAFAGCGLASVVLPSGVNVNTGEGVFANCVNLVTADLSRATGNYLGNSYFKGCAKLASVSFSSSITTIASSAFEGCVSLTDVVIPANVTCIQKDAFYGCSASLRLFLDDTSLPGGYEGLFNELDGSNGKAEYLLYSATEPDYASAGTQRYWHRGEGGVPTVWVKA